MSSNFRFELSRKEASVLVHKGGEYPILDWAFEFNDVYDEQTKKMILLDMEEITKRAEKDIRTRVHDALYSGIETAMRDAGLDGSSLHLYSTPLHNYKVPLHHPILGSALQFRSNASLEHLDEIFRAHHAKQFSGYLQAGSQRYLLSFNTEKGSDSYTFHSALEDDLVVDGRTWADEDEQLTQIRYDLSNLIVSLLPEEDLSKHTLDPLGRAPLEIAFRLNPMYNPDEVLPAVRAFLEKKFP